MSPSPPALDFPALTVAMTLVPAACSRNRFFGAFQDPVVSRARVRSILLRSLATQIAELCPRGARLDVSGGIDQGRIEVLLEYRPLRLLRRVYLSSTELSAVRYLVPRDVAPNLGRDDAEALPLDELLLRLLGPFADRLRADLASSEMEVRYVATPENGSCGSRGIE